MTKVNTIRLSVKKELSAGEIKELFNSKSIDKEWAFEHLKPSDTSKWTHGYHRYPAKFIPQLVERLFEEYIISESAKKHKYFLKKGA